MLSSWIHLRVIDIPKSKYSKEIICEVSIWWTDFNLDIISWIILINFIIYTFPIRVVREEENSSHETMSIELARPLNDTIQISLGQEELETLQTRFKLGKMLPNCLSSIHSHMFLQKGLNLGKSYRFLPFFNMK